MGFMKPCVPSQSDMHVQFGICVHTQALPLCFQWFPSMLLSYMDNHASALILPWRVHLRVAEEYLSAGAGGAIGAYPCRVVHVHAGI